jgi:hypothetical protein
MNPMGNTGDVQISDSVMHRLARKYLTLMQTLLGGHHQYMEQYNAYLTSMGFMQPNGEWNT